MFAWGRAVVMAMNSFATHESGLVRMFRTEYGKEYRHLRSMGCEINDNFVKKFLETRI